MFYRVYQFIFALFPHIASSEKEWCLKTLEPKAKELFLRQSLPEQRHAISVAKTIINLNHDLSSEDLQNLITAALLHDCGKSVVFIHLWQRVYIVIRNSLPKFLRSQLEKKPSVFAFSRLVELQHPLWGESLAKQADLNPVVCRLIREHHRPTPGTPLGHILQQADNHN